MYHDFMTSNYRGPDLWKYTAERRKMAQERGTIFSAEELARILALWAGAAIGAAIAHTIDALRLPLAAGGHVEITPTGIRLDHETPSPAVFRAAMAHAATHWQGRAGIPAGPSTGRAERLRLRAYAEVYGIELEDANEAFRHLAFTPAELATLPALRREIRALHQDAPPERPNEEGQLAAMYAARYPFRVHAAA